MKSDEQVIGRVAHFDPALSIRHRPTCDWAFCSCVGSMHPWMAGGMGAKVLAPWMTPYTSLSTQYPHARFPKQSHKHSAAMTFIPSSPRVSRATLQATSPPCTQP